MFMRPKLKISNITNLQDARYSAAVGFDFVSFSLERGSVKKLASNLVWNIINWLEGPEVVLELNAHSLEEVDIVGESFNFRYITMPYEEWSDLVFQTFPRIIIRADHQVSADQIAEVVSSASLSDFEVKFELALSDFADVAHYQEVLPDVFIHFSELALAHQLIASDYQPYGITLGEEAEEDQLLDYEQIDTFMEAYWAVFL